MEFTVVSDLSPVLEVARSSEGFLGSVELCVSWKHLVLLGCSHP